MPILPPSSGQHWFIGHREDAAKVLLLWQKAGSDRNDISKLRAAELGCKGDTTGTPSCKIRPSCAWLETTSSFSSSRRTGFAVSTGLLGSPGNGKTAAIRVMATHPYIPPYALDLSDAEEKSSDVLHLFEKASENKPALVILEDLDRAFPASEVLTATELSQRLKVKESWIVGQSKRSRTADNPGFQARQAALHICDLARSSETNLLDDGIGDTLVSVGARSCVSNGWPFKIA
jgi:hypothetical protein